VIKKFLQKIFKKVSYILFLKIYGKIEKSIEVDSDKRIKVEVGKIDNYFEYKIYKIPNGRLYTDRIHNTAIILENKIIEGPSFQLRYNNNSPISNNIVFEKGTPRILKNLNGIVLSLLTGGAGNDNYWHWLYDVLPRIGICNKLVGLNEIDFFLLPNLSKKFQNETLDCLNIPKHKRLSSEKYRHIKAKELIVTDHPVVVTGNSARDIQNIPRWIMPWLNSNFSDQKVTKNKKNKIYIERDSAILKKIPERAVSNENEVKSYLLKKGFVPVRLGEIMFSEQVDLFHNAEYIIGLHGGGFANLAFCKPGTKVIEFRSSTAGQVVENLAKKNNLNYNSIITEAKQIYKYNFPTQQGHVEIPISSLSKLLEN
jgi:capsular polysaccharide biosynthesis protein